MSILSRMIGRVAKLPPAETHDVLVERDLKIPMPDGVVLLANRYVPRGIAKPPLILVRCCYGRAGFFGLLYGQLFKAGHCLRLQISSGAHPRFARNTGSGEPLGTATKLLIANQSIYHDPQHPSAVVLSVLE
jgi:predicted acyl esterase